jgi:hypothetical protein
MTYRCSHRPPHGGSDRCNRPRRATGRLAVVIWAVCAPTAVLGLAVTGSAGTAQAASASSTTPTTSASSPPPPINPSLSPCDAPRQGAPCGVDPSQLQLNMPGGTDVTAVQLSWVAEPGRSSPVPGGPAMLEVANAASCSQGPCWTWPQSVDYSSGGTPWVLNGTYQVSPCSSQSGSGCTPSAYYGPSQVQIAVAPAAPANLSATSQGGTVTLRWQAGAEPDLVGYLISRNSEDIYTCSTNGFGPGAGRPCASPPSFSDNPGVGTWRYQVEALRFGQDASPAHVVHSLAATVVTSVNGAGGSPAAGAGGGPSIPGGPSPVHLSAPPIPPSGVMPAFIAPLGVAGRPPTTAAAPEGEPGAGGVNPNLPYSDNPALGSAQNAEATGTSERPPPKPVHSVDSVAEIAFAVIALSLAVHAWYIRDELRRAAARVAARKAFDAQGLQST